MPSGERARPKLLDNRSAERRHADALAFLAVEEEPVRPLAVATGFVNLGGLHHLATVVATERETRVLLGAAPEPGLDAGPPADRFATQLVMLGHERDLSRFPPSRASKRLLAVENWLRGESVDVRHYAKQFLHGKAYMFGSAENPRISIVSSANLTGAGLSSNLELGMVDYDPDRSKLVIDWFNTLWADAKPFKDELMDLLFPDIGLVDPETVYLRALFELYGDENEESPPDDLVYTNLTDFQRYGYDRARQILDRRGGVIYADGVGTGKTEIGLALIEHYALREGNYALVIAPKQLVKHWADRINQARLPAEVISFHQLAEDEQLGDQTKRLRRHLANNKDAYRLVVVDEAHALRNDNTTWHRAMVRLAGGQPKHMALLTATPINNGLWDLYNLVSLFAAHDRSFADAGVASLRKLFLAAGAGQKDPENLDPDLLFPLVDQVAVRRDRRFIEREYPDAQFADGTRVRFPRPILKTPRYDLDEAHPGLAGDIAAVIDNIELARYTPSRYLTDGATITAEVQLAGLLRSGILKRFESCWHACLATVNRMVGVHDAFLRAWDEQGVVLAGDALREAARGEVDAAGLATIIEEHTELEAADEVLDRMLFDPVFRDHVAADRDRLVEIRDRLRQLDAASDPKLRALMDLLEHGPARKVAVFATYADTIAYLDAHLPPTIGDRTRAVVIGGQTTPDERAEQLARFAPESVVEPGYVPPAGEVDLLFATDVLSEGQNLQQAQCVISYDMPWNPQRVVQRNGRVIRLRSPHDEVYLFTMLPKEGDLERLLGLEARIQAKIRAASLFGMESGVVEGDGAEESKFADELGRGLRSLTERLSDSDLAISGEDDDALSGAFLGEFLRARVAREISEGASRRVTELPWGIGAAFVQHPDGASRGAPGLFFATRTKPMDGASEGHVYWRYVEFDGDGAWREEPNSSILEILRRIDPDGSRQAGDPSNVQLDEAWRIAAKSIVEAHNERAGARAEQQSVGPLQRFARDLLQDPAVQLADGSGVELAYEALAIERSSSVRRSIGEIKERLDDGEHSRSTAAAEIVELVKRFGLRPDDDSGPSVAEPITEDDVGVVCWMAVLPQGSGGAA